MQSFFLLLKIFLVLWSFVRDFVQKNYGYCFSAHQLLLFYYIPSSLANLWNDRYCWCYFFFVFFFFFFFFILLSQGLSQHIQSHDRFIWTDLQKPQSYWSLTEPQSPIRQSRKRPEKRRTPREKRQETRLKDVRT